MADYRRASGVLDQAEYISISSVTASYGSAFTASPFKVF